MKNFYYIIICLMFLLSFNKISISQVLEQDSLALVALYDSTDGANWTNHENWLTGPVATWHGVTITGNRVTEINLLENNLTGTIPSEIGQLSSLTRLSFYKNQLTGVIPVEIGNLTGLTALYFQKNQLKGEIPAEIGNLTNLTKLALYNNQLTGEIPIEIGNLTNLIHLYLSKNQLTGEIPAEIGNLTYLTRLELNENQLTGEIPAEIGNLTNLTKLALYNNQLTGEIPVEIGNLTNLTCLYLNFNKIQGGIAKELGNLTNLIVLYLNDNQLTGSIPVELGNLINLMQLYISENQLTGEVPSELGNLINLKYMDIKNNRFYGELPSEISNMHNLERFYIGHNNFSGAVPSEFLNLTKLEYIQIQNNGFTDLPDFSPDTTIKSFNIQHNKFTFEDIEPNISIPDFKYDWQDSVGEKLDTTISAGTSLTLSVNVGGTANVYQWTKNGTVIEGATEDTLIIDMADTSDTGTYICEIRNTIATALTLYSREMNVTVEGTVGIENTKNKIPTKFALYQNYPNPFNPSTTIKYTIPRSFILPPLANGRAGVGSHVTLKIYNILGKEVITLVNKKQSLGYYKVTWDASNYPSGVYIYQIRAGSFVKSKKLILMK